LRNIAFIQKEERSKVSDGSQSVLTRVSVTSGMLKSQKPSHRNDYILYFGD